MWFPPSYWQSRFHSADAPTLTPGTLVAPGNSNSEGNWVEIISDANVTFDVWEIHVWVTGTDASGVARRCLLDIGADPAGGTSYTAIVSDLLCGGRSATLIVNDDNTAYFRIPIFIKSGSAIAARMQTSVASDTGNERVAMSIFGNPTRPEIVPLGQFTETIGLSGANSDGTDINFPGVANTWSSWTSLGTTSKTMWYWQIMTQNNETTMTNDPCLAQLSYGDVTNKVIIIPHYRYLQTNTESVRPASDHKSWNYHVVPGGSELFCRVMREQTSTTGGGYAALGVGG